MSAPDADPQGLPGGVVAENLADVAATPTSPRLAAGVILVRGGPQTLELLLVRRTLAARFMGGVWVFPGGAVDADDGDGERGRMAAATRELREEASITLPAATELVAFSRWVTPEALRIRYDSVFFLAPAPTDCEPVVDGEEMVDWRWTTPAAALAAFAAQEIVLAFPTAHDLEALSRHASADAAIADARTRSVLTTQPVVVMQDGTATVVIPPRES
jgi:8-oxo-dGTP pyrophosphatase MutT (NUDIX family)